MCYSQWPIHAKIEGMLRQCASPQSGSPDTYLQCLLNARGTSAGAHLLPMCGVIWRMWLGGVGMPMLQSGEEDMSFSNAQVWKCPPFKAPHANIAGEHLGQMSTEDMSNLVD